MAVWGLEKAPSPKLIKLCIHKWKKTLMRKSPCDPVTTPQAPAPDNAVLGTKPSMYKSFHLYVYLYVFAIHSAYDPNCNTWVAWN